MIPQPRSPDGGSPRSGELMMFQPKRISAFVSWPTAAVRTLVLVLPLIVALPLGAEPLVPIGTTFVGQDTLKPEKDGRPDAQACLEGLTWPTGKFDVRCQPARERAGDALIRFPSPVPSGIAENDLVAMEWYAARNDQGQLISAPAVVVVHESGSDMAVGRLFARGLRLQGLHAFMIQLPFYGERRGGGDRDKAERVVTLMRQAVADVRRARDAVAALPLVDAEHISLQGTSLGGFVSATSASLDRGYDQVFIMLAGGDLYDVIQNGGKDAANMRRELAAAGYSGEKLRDLVAPIEPTRIAHRLDPAQTWLFSAQFDTVVPPKNAKLLAAAAGLDRSHHIEMLANHYSGAIYVPYLLTQIHGKIRERSMPCDK